MKQPIIFVDFDRTIFQTDVFTQMAWDIVADTYGLDAARHKADIPEWYRHIAELRYYFFEGHVANATGRPADQVRETIRPLLAKKDFVYPDAHEALAYWRKQGKHIRVLTFGDDWFQTFKMSLVPDIAGIPRDMVLTNKGAFIAERFPEVQGVLIDDKRNPNLPKGVQEIWLNRAENSPIKKEDGIITINSLKSIQEAL